MIRRQLSQDLVDALGSSQLWRNFCLDLDLSPEVREGCVTVYYRSGALLRELCLSDGRLFADVHQKFVPLSRSGTSTQVSLAMTDVAGLTFVDTLAPLALGNGEPAVLTEYKRMMDQVLTGPEGVIVQSIIRRTENQIIDQEIAFQETGQSRDQIDLCHFDTGLRKLVFVEVKRISDKRLFLRNGSVEVLDQLAAYGRRLCEQKREICDVYRSVVRWKRELGLGGRLVHVPQDCEMDLLEKPVLVIGDCSDDDVKRINAAAEEWAPLMQGLPMVAAGYILCGKNGCSLRLNNRGQARSYL